MRWLTVLAAVLLMPSLPRPSHAYAQELPDSASKITPALPLDSIQQGQPVPLRSIAGAKVDSLSREFHPSKSPGLAMLLSAVLPGAGQVYNQSYWKVPIIVGLGLYFTSGWLDQNRRYHDSRDKYTQSLAVDPAGDPRELARRDFYRDQRDMFTWYFAILYFVNIADAYVDASLYDFNVGGDLSVRFLPETKSLVRVQISF